MQNEKYQETFTQDHMNNEVMSTLRKALPVSFNGFVTGIYVTPEIAETFLKYNTRNRHISEIINERYARIMKAGNWKFNGEPIIFSDKGILLDGQNRLKAVSKSKVTVPMIIVYGVEEENFSTIDQGSKRTAGQVLNILECKRSNTLAAALRIAYIYFDVDSSLSCSSVPYVYNEVLLNFLEQHPEIEDSIAKVGSANSLCSSSVLAFCHFVFTEKSQEDADTFLNQLLLGEDLHGGHAILALRSRLFKSKNSKTDIPTRELIALIFKTWNYCRRMQNIKNLTWHPYDGFPEVI